MHEFLGVNLLCTVRGDVVFFLPWSYVNEKEKKIIKNQKCKIKNKTKMSGDMVKRYLFTKFGINLLDGF